MLASATRVLTTMASVTVVSPTLASATMVSATAASVTMASAIPPGRQAAFEAFAACWAAVLRSS